MKMMNRLRRISMVCDGEIDDAKHRQTILDACAELQQHNSLVMVLWTDGGCSIDKNQHTNYTMCVLISNDLNKWNTYVINACAVWTRTEKFMQKCKEDELIDLAIWPFMIWCAGNATHDVTSAMMRTGPSGKRTKTEIYMLFLSKTSDDRIRKYKLPPFKCEIMQASADQLPVCLWPTITHSNP